LVRSLLRVCHLPSFPIELKAPPSLDAPEARCVEKVLAAPDAQAQLVALKAIDSSYRQRQFIEAGG
jgi:hypothetical protein